MKSIKKYILIIAVALLTISLSACGTKVTAEEAINKVAETNLLLTLLLSLLLIIKQKKQKLKFQVP